MVDIQTYEDYWSITLAFTNFYDWDFVKFLKVCIEYIDQHKNTQYTPEKYSQLQNKIKLLWWPTNLASVRKIINEYLKLWFISSYLDWYIPDALTYIDNISLGKRKFLFSKIVYSNSSFNRSVTEDSDVRQISFLMNTLMNVGSLNKDEIAWLMLVDVNSFVQEWLNKEQLQMYVKQARSIGFAERKYNQISYLCNLLWKLDDVRFVDNVLYFKDDAEEILWNESDNNSNIHIKSRRDPYLYRLYKKQLKDESISIFWWDRPKCMLEKLAFPVLVASHIKPFIQSNESEAYDPNNWILLSRTMDSLFDLWYISFSWNWEIIFSPRLSEDVIEYLWEYSLDSRLLNNERKEYLEFHRNHVLRM